MAYTIDIIKNHNWILPVDADGVPATKPQLFNYLSVLPVMLMGPNAWSFPLPSLLMFFATLWLMYVMARDVTTRLATQPSIAGLSQHDWMIILSIAFYALSSTTLRLAFIARADMLLVFFLTLSYHSANRALQRSPTGACWAIVFWAAAGFAAAAKGPLAVVPIAYAFLAAKLFHGGWHGVAKLLPLIGAPIALAIGAGWPLAAYVLNPDHVQSILIEQELGGLFHGHWYSGLITWWEVPALLIGRFLPWSLLFAIAVFRFPWRDWRKHPLAPPLLYIAILAVPFIAVASRRGDRFAAFHPQMALVAAWGAVYATRGLSLLRSSIAAIPITAICMSIYFCFLSEEAIDRTGQEVVNFVHRIKTVVGSQPVIACKFDNHSFAVQALLGLNQRGQYPSRAAPKGNWIITPVNPGADRIAVASKPLYRPGARAQLFLYHAWPNELICDAS